MKAYIIVDVTITDTELYESYKKLTPRTLDPFGGKFLVRGGPTETLEGNWNPGRFVILEFPTIEKAREWYKSNEYEGAKAIRQRAAHTQMILVEGFD